jgi:hypothetical protein
VGRLQGRDDALQPRGALESCMWRSAGEGVSCWR